jgi:hypothetical protein
LAVDRNVPKAVAMTVQGVNLETAAVALDRTNGHAFEAFAKVLFAAILGIQFVPLGGSNDGGADGLEEVFGTQTAHYVQITRQEDHRAKIRHTVLRLRQVGRSPTRLTYITSRGVSRLDQEEEFLADELNIGITIRDRSYILAHLNSYPAAVVAFQSYLATFVGNLLQVGAVPLFSTLSSDQLTSAVVFLSQELENRAGTSPLTEKIVDTLIIWALRDTDPDQDVLMTRGQVLAAILEVLPGARSMVTGSLDHRLRELCSKNHPEGRQINSYKRRGTYCLPFQTRTTVQAENAADLLLRETVLGGFKDRALAIATEREFSNVDATSIADICLATIEMSFEAQGLAISRSISESGAREAANLLDIVVDRVREIGLSGDLAVRTADVALNLIRGAFYTSTEWERRLFNRWSKTYALLFSIQNDINIVEWMRQGAARFHLYIGSDILVRVLSEQFLHQEDQLCTNALKILSSSGATLILTEPVLDEVFTHIGAADYEYQNHYAEQEPYLTLDIAQACSRLLIRTYLYAKMQPIDGIQAPRGWMSFMDGFLPYEQLHRPAGKDALKHYLLEQYKMGFNSSEDLAKLVEPDSLAELAERVATTKSRKENATILARNDALMVLAVYGQRLALGEAHRPNPFGYRVWWLTNESSIRNVTFDLVKARGADYMLRPEFVMQYVALNPSMDAVRRSFAKIFPSTLSISLGARVPDEVLHQMLDRLRKSEYYNDARLKVEAAALSNRLMADFGRSYHFLP